MSRTTLRTFTGASIALLAILAPAQPPQPNPFTLVAQFEFPRERSPEVAAWADKTVRPICERLIAAGTLTGYSINEAILHTEGGYTHAFAFTALTFASLEKARLEILSAPSLTVAPTRHADLLVRSPIGAARPGFGTGGYLRGNVFQLQAGKDADWRASFEKYNKATWDALLADGTITAYAYQNQYVAGLDLSTRFFIYLMPNADGPDRVSAALAAANRNRPEAERVAMEAVQAGLIVPGSQRSFLSRALFYSFK